MMVRVAATPAELDAAVRRAAAAIAAGGIVAIPTDTLYGLAANPFDAAAVGRLFAAKGRPDQRPIPLVAADRAQVAGHLGALPPLGDRLAARYWPGPLTLLIRAPDALAPAISAGTGRVGVRVPAHAVTRALCAAAGHPITATSANRSGDPATADPDEVARTMGDRIDVLLDGGRTPGGAPSTIVDVSEPQVRLVRAGAVPWEEIDACAAGR
jgi:L-threonylcarbamoyladenylate synthase